MPILFNQVGAYKFTFTTGAVTTIAAGTGTAGHLLAIRNTSAALVARVRSIEAELIMTTAFASAQEVGFDAFILRSYSAAHTGGTALTLTGGRKATSHPDASTALTGRISNTAELTAGTHTLDANPIARSSGWASGQGSPSLPRLHEFGDSEFESVRPGGFLLGQNEGLLIRNLVLMGAVGVGKWHFTIGVDLGITVTG